MYYMHYLYMHTICDIYILYTYIYIVYIYVYIYIYLLLSHLNRRLLFKIYLRHILFCFKNTSQQFW